MWKKEKTRNHGILHAAKIIECIITTEDVIDKKYDKNRKKLPLFEQGDDGRIHQESV